MKRMTIDEKELAIVFHLRGYKKSRIAKQIGFPRNIISSMIKAWKKEKRRRQRRRPKLSAQQVLNVHNYFIKNPFGTYDRCIQRLELPVKKGTVRRVLTKRGVRYYTDSQEHFLEMQNRIKRSRFALKYQHWTGHDWLKVSFLGECTVQQQPYFSGIILVKRQLDERRSSQKITTNEQRVQVNLVVVASHNGPNILYAVSDNFQAKHFKQLIKRRVKDVIGSKFLSMDNTELHSKGIEYLTQSGIKVLDFPSDLDIVADVGTMLQRKINLKRQASTVSTRDELLKIIDESWREIPDGFVKNCILSMPQRLKDVIKNEGGLY
ncbi:uncharacterized protein LOC119085553 [Bradysia coprophila]|uniref:uncharacterized protein LOC119085553 n=1 Tax=Bradysia coprophila TaxID=38358 RepID=UPI00187D9752|nr:uncharacterized protein LOC119085553 [Bradysia coprophila]XP_037051878.1 uncharacterized protein LOC119085553 [Bradysia coprophila]